MTREEDEWDLIEKLTRNWRMPVIPLLETRHHQTDQYHPRLKYLVS